MGVHRAKDDSIRNRRSAFVDSVLDQFSAVSIDLRIAREHSRITAELISAGEMIGVHDSWIATTALTYGYAVATTNVREFDRVSGLEVIPIMLS